MVALLHIASLALAEDVARTGLVHVDHEPPPPGTVVEVLDVDGVRGTLPVDAEGTFTGTWHAEHRPMVRARAPGLISAPGRMSRRRTVLELQPAQTVEVEVQPPTAEVLVIAISIGTGHPDRWTLEGRLGHARTNAQGAASVEIPAGNDRVQILALGPDATVGMDLDAEPGTPVEVTLAPTELPVLHTGGLRLARPDAVDPEGWVAVAIDGRAAPTVFDAGDLAYKLEPGSWRVWVQDRTAFRAGLFEVEVPPGEVVDVEPRWDATRSLHGVVVDPDGAPVQGVWIYARTLTWVDGQRLRTAPNGRGESFLSYTQATTDADGAFALTGLLGDRWDVVVNNARWEPITADQADRGPVRLVVERPVDDHVVARSRLAPRCVSWE